MRIFIASQTSLEGFEDGHIDSRSLPFPLNSTEIPQRTKWSMTRKKNLDGKAGRPCMDFSRGIVEPELAYKFGSEAVVNITASDW